MDRAVLQITFAGCAVIEWRTVHPRKHFAFNASLAERIPLSFHGCDVRGDGFRIGCERLRCFSDFGLCLGFLFALPLPPSSGLTASFAQFLPAHLAATHKMTSGKKVSELEPYKAR